jgi:MFS family permease
LAFLSITNFNVCRYAVDSLLLLLQSIIATQAGYEFTPSYSHALTVAVYMGMLFGALFWGLSGDIIGRKFAFNVSLFICSVFATIAGASPNWATLAVFIAFLGFGGGGNLIMDTTVFIEYLPSDKQWVLTWLASWWGLGQAIAGFIAWGFLCAAVYHSQLSCRDMRLTRASSPKVELYQPFRQQWKSHIYLSKKRKYGLEVCDVHKWCSGVCDECCTHRGYSTS